VRRTAQRDVEARGGAGAGRAVASAPRAAPRRRQARTPTASVLGAQELDAEALDRQQSEDRQRRRPGRHSAAQQPDAEAPDQQRQGGLVELRRMDGQQGVGCHAGRHLRPHRPQVGGGGERHPFGEDDADRQVGRAAVVVADQKAADPPDGVAERERRGEGVGGRPGREPPQPHDQQKGGDGEHEAAVPDQARAVEEQAPVVVEDRVVHLGADDPPEAGGQEERAGVVVVPRPQPHQAPPELEVAGQEGQHQHHPERADRERADVEELLDHGGAES
jgi:hypothetical protein